MVILEAIKKVSDSVVLVQPKKVVLATALK